MIRSGEDPIRQGGDFGRDEMLPPAVADISTCLNGCGPPPVTHVLTALSRAPAPLHRHPFGVAEAMAHDFAAWFNAPSGNVLAEHVLSGRGVSEFLPLAVRVFSSVHFIPPDYTDYGMLYEAMPCHEGGIAHGETDTITALHRLGDRLTNGTPHGVAIILSNPHNPLGRCLTRSVLEPLIAALPQVHFILDESFVEFSPRAEALSLLGTALANVTVLRSPAKSFGMAGVRVGALWSRNGSVREAFAAHMPKWSLSPVDVALLKAAFQERPWLEETTERLRVHMGRIRLALAARGYTVMGDRSLHFGFMPLPPKAAATLHDYFMDAGFAVRLKTPREGISGIRLCAPDEPHLDALLEAIAQMPISAPPVSATPVSGSRQ